MNGKMKVVEIQDDEKIGIVEKDIPTPKKGEALLKIKYCGICGSDIQTYRGTQPFASYPRIPGHEFSAKIVEIEDNDKGLKEGMIVTANPYFNCGECYPCKKGNVNCCEDNQTMGVQRDGSFSEYITMPIERVYDGKGLDSRTLAMVEPFSIGYHAINRAEIKENENVLVLGAGPIGIFAMISAKIKGANVYIADFLQNRLDIAMELGANGFINLTDADIKERTLELTNNNGMDVVVEATGVPESFLNAINTSAFGGRIALIGNGKREVQFNQSLLIKKELNVYGSRNSLNDFEPLIEVLKQGEIDIDKMVTDVYDFEESLKAFNDLIENPSRKLKVLIKFD